MAKGKLIVLEGNEGCGKSTQLKLLVERLKKEGKDVLQLHFPKHEVSFGKVVDAYLRGEFGSKDLIPPEFIAMLYMADFYESKKLMDEALSHGKFILLSRYFSSTLTYQVALEKNDKDSLWEWIRSTCSRLPQPDAVFVLDVPLEISKKVLENANRAEAYKQGAKKDQHESDLNFLKKISEEYERNIEKLGWRRIICTKNGLLLSAEEISNKVWSEVNSL